MIQANRTPLYIFIVSQLVAVSAALIFKSSDLIPNSFIFLFYIKYSFTCYAVMGLATLISAKNNNIATKFLLNIVSSLFFLLTFAEICNYYVTSTTFSYAFWNLLSFPFIINSLLVYKSFSTLIFIILCILLTLNYKIIKHAFKIDKVRDLSLDKSIILTIFCILYIISFSPIKGAIESFCVYKITNSDSNYKLIKEPANKATIFSKANNSSKNIIHIYLESFAYDFTDESKFPGLTPNLNKLKEEGLLLTNLQQVKYGQYSEAGHIITNTGNHHLNNLDEEKETNIAEVLKKANYSTMFIRGASEVSGGALFNKVYSKEKGYDNYIAFKELNEIYPNKKTGKWGYNDDIIFKFGLEQFNNKSKKDNHFYISLFTLDTHEGQDVSSSCKKLNYQGKLKNLNIIKSVHCTDFLIGNFIKELKKDNNYKNTLIVINSDHSPFKMENQLNNRESFLFGLVLNSNTKPFKQNNESFLFDIPTTIIKNINIETNAVFPLGENLSNKKLIREIKTSPPFKNIELDINDNKYKNIYHYLAYILN